MIALNHKWTSCRFVFINRTTCWTSQLHIFMQNDTIHRDFNILGIGNFFTCCIESRRLKRNIDMLPKTWCKTSILKRCMAFPQYFSAIGSITAAFVNTSTVTIFRVFDAPTIQKLHFITPHQVKT